GVGVPALVAAKVAKGGVGDQRDGEGDDEGPGTAEAGDVIGDAFAEGLLLVDEFVGIAEGAATDDALGVMDLGGEDGEHVEARLRLLFEQDGDVSAIDL